MPPRAQRDPAATADDSDGDTRPDPTPKSGKWEALTNLSVGRPGDQGKQADVVHPGETVTLTEEQAHGFLTNHRVPVIRPADEAAEAHPTITARSLFGQRPRAEQFGARPDPAGATKVITPGQDPGAAENAPEASDPVAPTTGA